MIRELNEGGIAVGTAVGEVAGHEAGEEGGGVVEGGRGLAAGGLAGDGGGDGAVFEAAEGAALVGMAEVVEEGAEEGGEVAVGFEEGGEAVDEDGVGAEFFEAEAPVAQGGEMGFEEVEFAGAEGDGKGGEEGLGGEGPVGVALAGFFVEDAFPGGAVVEQDEAFGALEDEVVGTEEAEGLEGGEGRGGFLRGWGNV